MQEVWNESNESTAGSSSTLCLSQKLPTAQQERPSSFKAAKNFIYFKKNAWIFFIFMQSVFDLVASGIPTLKKPKYFYSSQQYNLISSLH